MKEQERLITSFVEAVNRQDWSLLQSLVALNFRRHSYAAGTPGVSNRDQLVQFLKDEFATFPDAHESIEDIFSDGDKVAVRHRFQGTQKGALGPHPPSGKRMISEYIAIYRIEDGRIVEAWAEWDNLSGLAQLGLADAQQRAAGDVRDARA
ncbi:MAG: ester cyclase [Kiritimatiellae bacterium]|nr:ester cyclase [Kiritimatiellia bacterium]